MVTKKQLRFRVFDMRCLVSQAIGALNEMMSVKPICPKCGHVQVRTARKAHENSRKLLLELRKQRDTEWNKSL